MSVYRTIGPLVVLKLICCLAHKMGIFKSYSKMPVVRNFASVVQNDAPMINLSYLRKCEKNLRTTWKTWMPVTYILTLQLLFSEVIEL